MKRILVTGGSRGLGLAICRRLLTEGHHIISASRRLSPELSELRSEHSDRLEFFAVDFADKDAAAQLSISARLLEGVDAFVANAAIGTEGLLTLTSNSAVEECIQVNLVAPLLLAREVIKGMLTRGGSLVFISSVAAQTGFAGLTVYSATKGALVSFSRSLAREYGERGIRSNCILPGFLETEMSQSLGEEDRARLRRRIALKRLGQVQDVVGGVSFLISDEARYVTGTEMVIDGGLSA
ncbi:MAG: SDR family oxidoreductase [Chloroflexi bacterium]|nr:SDR family oxidoreductase [Chloroflexota bacterium]